MPGSSLWLLPPPSHPLTPLLTKLINSAMPSLFPSITPPTFAPHVTLTSGIKPSVYGSEPQQWLDSLPWPKGADVKVAFSGVRSEDVFFRRCYIAVVKGGVESVAGVARAKGVFGEEGPRDPQTKKWVEENYGPHNSLMYAEIRIDGEKLKEIENVVTGSGIALDGNGELGGWTGGVVWLVPTDRPVGQWKPIAAKEL